MRLFAVEVYDEDDNRLYHVLATSYEDAEQEFEKVMRRLGTPREELPEYEITEVFVENLGGTIYGGHSTLEVEKND